MAHSLWLRRIGGYDSLNETGCQARTLTFMLPQSIETLRSRLLQT